MPNSESKALGLSRRVLRLLILVNLVTGGLILLLLVASLVSPDWVFRALGVPGNVSNGALIFGMRLVMVVGVLATPLTHVVLSRLLAIVLTVGDGDPFVAENARRLQLIAWAVLALEILHLGVGLIQATVSTFDTKLDLGWRFSLRPWLAVLLLFVLARVFDRGTRMREDLEGTI
jgi:Protein of unknown function (DUF2975)